MFNYLAKKTDEKLGKRDVAEGSTQPLQSWDETMRAVTWEGKESVKVSDVLKPVISHPDDVIVKVTACTICSGSDSHLFGNAIPGIDKGFVMGHEACGTIHAVGASVTKFSLGDRVVIAFNIACGKCAFCQRITQAETPNTLTRKLAETPARTKTTHNFRKVCHLAEPSRDQTGRFLCSNQPKETTTRVHHLDPTTKATT
jgi:Zn-dependent alcohol dehydrogenase